MNTKVICYDKKGNIEKVSICKGLEQFLDNYEYYTKHYDRYEIEIIDNGFQVLTDDGIDQYIMEEYIITNEML